MTTSIFRQFGAQTLTILNLAILHETLGAINVTSYVVANLC